MKRVTLIAFAIVLASFAFAATKRRVVYDSSLPPMGTKLRSLPAGNGRQIVESSCFACHSADMLLQQRLTEKQWIAEVDKMIRWGAVMKESDKPAAVAYLSKHFGADNKFAPVITRPVGY